MKTHRIACVSATALFSALMAVPANAVFFHTTSGSIDGSLCVGFDCVSSESFGFDTIRMKENNLRLHYEDTSSSASFPSNDWRIEINASSNGGSNHYAIQDATAGRNVAVIEAGAPSNSLRVDSAGRIGITEDNPVVELHITNGDSPTVRLEQDGSSGFTPQTWDMAGNETNFFVRDVTHGSKLPFKILDDAPTNSLVIETTTGDIGLGTASPDAPLHVRGTDGLTSVHIEEANGTSSNTRVGLTIENNGASQLALVDSNNSSDWRFQNFNDAFRVSKVGTGNPELALDNTGNMTILGTLTENSDKNAKMAIVPVASDEILEKVMALPVAHWTYKDQAEEGIRHIGPMAQDFRALFGTGHTDTGISTIDTSGVALAAIQALQMQNSELRELIVQQNERLEKLEAMQ